MDNELYLARCATPQASFAAELESLLAELSSYLPTHRVVWLRFHVSDISNQYAILSQILANASFAAQPFIWSAVGQAPCNRAKIAMEAYLLPQSDRIRITMPVCGQLLVTLPSYRLLFCHADSLRSSGSHQQMSEEFNRLTSVLHSYGGSLEANLQRTWIYCRDIDNNYAGLVVARRNLFNHEGLTPSTHTIASTGIEAKSEPFNRLVRMDSFALFGHRRSQIEIMQALDHLSPTHVYGVTFERATRIIYGDRSHFYISGTASIDKDGNILYPGDITSQTQRVIDNVEALLNNHCGNLDDLKQAVVYLRDPADWLAVSHVLDSRLSPATQRFLVHGSVCRPGWLVEMDGIATNANGNTVYRPYLG